jgi:hypothetical protein
MCESNVGAAEGNVRKQVGAHVELQGAAQHTGAPDLQQAQVRQAQLHSTLLAAAGAPLHPEEPQMPLPG